MLCGLWFVHTILASSGRRCGAVSLACHWMKQSFIWGKNCGEYECVVSTLSVDGNLHSVDDSCRWINDHAELVAWHWQGKLKCSEQKLSQCQLLRHRSYMDWPGVEMGPPRWEAGGWLRKLWHDQNIVFNRREPKWNNSEKFQCQFSVETKPHIA